MHFRSLRLQLSLLALLSCSARAAEGPPVTLRYFLGWTLGAGDQDVIQEFERRNPGIQVVAGLSASRNMVEDPQRLLCAIVGGDPPDLVIFDRYAVAEWAARGAFRPLDDFVARDRGKPDGIQPDEYFPACWDEARWQGSVYAIPTGTDNRALYYNRDLLVAAGLVDATGEAKPPRTWDELEDYALKLSEFTRDARGAITGIRRIGFIPNYGNAWFYFYSWLNDGALLSPDGLTCTLGSPENVEAMQYVTDLYDKLGGARLVEAFRSGFQGGELDPFLTGRVAMKIDGNWVLNTIGVFRRELNFAVAPAPLPRTRLEAGKPYISWAGGWAWVIPKGARHPDEAWRLIQWLASEEAAIILHDAVREANQAQGKLFIPGLNANRRITQTLYRRYLAEDPNVEQKFRDAYQVFMNLLPESRYRPITPVGQFLWNQQVQAMEAAIYHRGSVAQVLQRHAAEVQRELDRVHRAPTGARVNWSVPLAAYVALLVAVALVLWWRHRRQSRSRGYFRREQRAGVLFALPWLIGFIVFTGGPIVFSFLISFCEYDVLSPGRWVWLDNYRYLLSSDPVFWKSVANTCFMLIGVPLGMAVSLGLAMLLNQKVKGMSAWRTLFYLPAIMPGVASALLWMWMFQPTDGILNRLFDLVGLNWLLKLIGVQVPVLWLQSEATSKPAIILMGLWGAGAGMIIWLAGLKGIPEHLYEAAEIDGAGRWQKFRHVTLPMLTPYIFFNLLMGMIGTLQVFESAYIMTNGGPVNSTLFFALHLFNNAFRFFRMGQACAMAWVLCLIVLAITIVQLRTARMWVHYESE
ncbi:MAG TPA: extracellular solute-binding protein [Planctomycetota bacterium]|nr:extracellular solute-binding protein [Planctomycetota bacterium]